MGARLIRAEEAPHFEVEGAQVVGYASPSRGSMAVSTWRVVLGAGVSSPVHQLTVDETFIALEGAAEYHVGTRVYQVRAGDGFTVEAGTAFRIANTGLVPFQAVVCVPAGAQAQIGEGQPFIPPWAA